MDTEGGFDRFEAGCAHATSLEKLYLANNLIGERGAVEIGKIIEKSSSIREVYL